MSLTPPSQPLTIDQAQLRRVRNLARVSGRSVLAELEHLNNGTSDALVQQLAAMFGMTAIDLPGLLAVTPAFDLLPLMLAQEWRCLLVRDADGVLSGVLADPFDPDLQLWLNTQARGPVLMRIASSTDLHSCLAGWASHGRSGKGSPSTGRGLMADGQTPAELHSRAEPADDAATEQMLSLTRDLLKRVMRRA